MKNKLVHLLTLAMLFLAPTVWGGDSAFYAKPRLPRREAVRSTPQRTRL